MTSANAQTWSRVATISSTLGNHIQRLCIGAEISGGLPHIGCPTYAPSLTTAGDVSVTGSLSAQHFVGDGSQLTGITANPADRIVSGTTSIVANHSGSLTFTTAGVQRMAIDNGGNVGIGTTSNTSAFMIKRKLNTPVGIEIQSDNSAAFSRLGGLVLNRFHYDPLGDAAAIDFYRGEDAADAGIIFRTKAGLTLGISATERMRINPDGLVGIGTTSPTRALTVSGSIAVYSPDSLGYELFRNGVNLGGLRGISHRLTLVDVKGDGIWLENNAGSPMMYVSNTRVGIGTINPNARLEVNGDISATNLRLSGNLYVSGSQQIGGVVFANRGVSATGGVSATYFSGDGSRLTNVTANLADRIVSGTATLIGHENRGVSSSVPVDVSGSVRISGTLQLAQGTGGEVCGPQNHGTLRINPNGSIELCLYTAP